MRLKINFTLPATQESVFFPFHCSGWGTFWSSYWAQHSSDQDHPDGCLFSFGWGTVAYYKCTGETRFHFPLGSIRFPCLLSQVSFSFITHWWVTECRKSTPYVRTMSPPTLKLVGGSSCDSQNPSSPLCKIQVLQILSCCDFPELSPRAVLLIAMNCGNQL